MTGLLKADRREWALRALAAFVALAPLPFFLRGWSVFFGMLGDEGVVLNGAWRLLQGQVPHRDFYSILPPGAFGVLAAVESVTGPSLTAARLLAWANYLLVLLLFWALAKRAGVSRLWAAAALPTFLLFYAVSWNMLSHHWMACAWALFSAWLLLHREGEPWRPWAAGAAAAAAGLTLQDLGLYWTAAAALALGLCGGEGRVRRALSFLGGTAAVGLPVMGLLMALAGPGAVLEDLVTGPLSRYQSGYLNTEPFGSGFFVSWRTMASEFGAVTGLDAAAVALHGTFRGLAEVVLAAAFAAAPAVLLWAALRRKEAWRRGPLPLLAALWAAMVGTLLHHPAGAAFYWAMPAVLLLAFLGLEWGAEGWGPRRRAALALALAAPGLVAGTVYLARWTAGPARGALALPGAVLSPAGDSERETLALAERFRREMFRPGQRVFCYEYNPALYPFLRIPNPYRYDLLILPMLSPGQQEAFWRELEAAPPHWILWDRQRVGKEDPVFSWMEQRYRPVAIAPGLVVLGPKGTTGPQAAAP